MVGACRAVAAPPISHLPLRNPKTIRIKNSCHQNKTKAFRAQLSNRRLFLFSIPLSSFIFLPFPAFCEGDSVISQEYDPVTRSERDASALISQRVSRGVELLEKGRELQALGDFNGALQYFSQVTQYPFIRFLLVYLQFGNGLLDCSCSCLSLFVFSFSFSDNT